MSWKRIFPYIFLCVLFAIWLSLLWAVYIPTMSWSTPTFPLMIDPNLKTMFLASTVLLALFSLFIGLEELGMLSHIAHLLGYRKNE
jgi:hypothetical protein